MKFLKMKKGIAALAAVAIVAIAAIGAYAYFTNTGEGTKTDAVEVLNPPDTLSWTVSFGTTAYAGESCPACTLAPTVVADPNAVVATVPFTITNDTEADEFLDTYTASIVPAPCVTPTVLQPTSSIARNAVVETVPFTITNTEESNQLLESYKAEIDPTWNVPAGTVNLTDGDGCDATDFKVGGEALGSEHVVNNLGVTLAPASDAPGNAADYDVTVQMLDDGSNQDDCQGATPDLKITACSVDQ